MSLQEKLNEALDKLKQAMLNNAQLDNEKGSLKFELENIKDDMDETEEKHISLVKEHRKKNTVRNVTDPNFSFNQKSFNSSVAFVFIVAHWVLVCCVICFFFLNLWLTISASFH